MDNKIICICGQILSGKTSLATYLAKKLGWQVGSFAYEVKKLFCETFDCDMAFIEKWKRNPESPPGFQTNVRKSLQFIGDGFRSIQSQTWINKFFKNLDGNVCIDDGRYLSEAQAVKRRGGINVLLWRPFYENDDSNLSESQIKAIIDKYFLLKQAGLETGEDEECGYFDILIRNDGTLEDLYKKVDEIIVPYLYK